MGIYNLFRRLTAPPSPKGKAFKNLDFKIKSLAKTITKDKISSAFPFGEGAEERGGRGYVNQHLPHETEKKSEKEDKRKFIFPSQSNFVKWNHHLSHCQNGKVMI
jgi:hypothetical protein